MHILRVCKRNGYNVLDLFTSLHVIATLCHFLLIKYLRQIGSLQVAIHVVQNHCAGEQKSHWDKTNKRHT